MAQPPHQQQQQQPVPPWVRHLAATTFFGTCTRHSHHPRSKCNFYCAVCGPASGQGLCQLCVQEHGEAAGGCSGFPTQVYRYMYSDVLRVADFGIDLDGIQVYQANNHPAVHLRPWELSEGKSPSAYTEDCEGGCGRKLLSQWRYCSLECKIRAVDGQPRSRSSSRQALGTGSAFLGGGMATSTGAGPSSAAAAPAYQLLPQDPWPTMSQLAAPAAAAAAALQMGSLGSGPAYSNMGAWQQMQQTLPPPGAWAGSSAAGAGSIPGAVQPAVLAMAAALAGAMAGSGAPQQPWQGQAPAPLPGGISSALAQAQAQQHLLQQIQQLQQARQVQQVPLQQQSWGSAPALPALLQAALESREAQAAAAAGGGPAAGGGGGAAQGGWQQQYRSSSYQALQQREGLDCDDPPPHIGLGGAQSRGSLLSSQDPTSSELATRSVPHSSTAQHGQPQSQPPDDSLATGLRVAVRQPSPTLPHLAEGGPGEKLAALAVAMAAAGAPHRDATAAAPRFVALAQDPPFQQQQQQQQARVQLPWPAGLGPDGSGASSASGGASAAGPARSTAGPAPGAAAIGAPSAPPTLAAPLAASLAALGSSKSLDREYVSPQQRAQQAQQAQQGQGQPREEEEKLEMLVSTEPSSGLDPVTASVAEQEPLAETVLLAREDGTPEGGTLGGEPASASEAAAGGSELEGGAASGGPEPKRRRKLGSPRAAPAR